MKLVDDKDIVKKVKETTNYEIKLSSAKILADFNSVQEQEKQRKKRVFTMTSIGTFGTLALGGAIAAIIIVGLNNSSNNPGNITPINPVEFVGINDSEILASEILTFTGFTNGESTNALGLHKTPLRAYTFQYAQSAFDNVVTEFDNVYFGIESIFNFENTVIVDKAEDNVINNETFKYTSLIYSASNNLVGQVYYNDLSTFDYEEENISYLNAYYETGNSLYHLYINRELEADNHETEIELEATFINVTNTSEIYKIGKESEYSGHESENSYSYKIYDSRQALRNDSYIYCLEYEIEIQGTREEIEMNIEKIEGNNVHEYEYQDIIKVNDSTYTFLTEYEDELNDQEFEFNVTLTIQNSTRTYTSENLSKSF